MLSTVADAERSIAVVFETSKVAISVGLLGTVFGVQFAADNHSPLGGLRFQVALPAKVTRELTNVSRR